jgi:hypothetical protein
LHIEFVLDALDPLAERRLLQAKAFRSPCDVAFLCHCNKLTKMAQLHDIAPAICILLNPYDT